VPQPLSNEKAQANGLRSLFMAPRYWGLLDDPELEQVSETVVTWVAVKYAPGELFGEACVSEFPELPFGAEGSVEGSIVLFVLRVSLLLALYTPLLSRLFV
jgi:hypothetical protein